MSAINRLYDISNKSLKKSITIDDSLYEQLIYLTNNKFDATISDLLNVCIEDYAKKNKPSYYEKPANETTTYRTVMLRKNNILALKQLHKNTGISMTRLLNSAIKDFLDTLK